MANSLSVVMPKLLAQGLMAMRQMAVLPRYVNRGYEAIAAEKGSVVTIPIPSAIAAQAVTPSYVPPDDADVAPTSTTITLDQWWEAPFYMTDKDLLEIMAGTIPMQASEAVKSLANKIDSLLITKAEQTFPNFAGTAGTVPYGNDLSEFNDVMAQMDDRLAPVDNRFHAVSAKTKGQALNLRAFQDAAWRGDTAGIIKGEIGEKLGAFWFMDQNLTRHTAGTGTGYKVNLLAGYAVGDTTLAVDTGSGTVLAGDKITFSGGTTTYTVASSTGGASVTQIVLSTPLMAAVADNEDITIVASHRQNFVFHRDALALATRPFAASDPMGLGTFLSMVDPVSGLAMRLEVSRQHKRTRWSFDILCGVGAPRPEWGGVVLGE